MRSGDWEFWLSLFGALTLIHLVVRALRRFTVRGSTAEGLLAGLTFGLLVLIDPLVLLPVAVVVAVCAAVTARYRPGEPGAALAAICLLLFPAAAAFGSSAFLSWRLG
ncbi:hypothetical protein KIH74_18105 [Kineosporia sp. J2-2]|uniref:Uncharacterized protein n=1 Tax=Kineosporia corallincola TaxID=2835133 RepID=A0ABS5TIG5_9ACTN|nr:hypothetical protein [Kineosporia corallincola]MBT0770862.1 hypothetical protein [Kineosporia corallincola]